MLVVAWIRKAAGVFELRRGSLLDAQSPAEAGSDLPPSVRTLGGCFGVGGVVQAGSSRLLKSPCGSFWLVPLAGCGAAFSL